MDVRDRRGTQALAVLAGTAAALAVPLLVAGLLPLRPVAVVVAVLVVVALSGAQPAVLAAALPVAVVLNGFLRRVSAGHAAYVEGDPVILAPLLLLAVLLAVTWRRGVVRGAVRGGPARPLLAFGAWLAVTALAGAAAPAATAYGLLAAGLPVLLGVWCAAGLLGRREVVALLGSTLVCGVVAALYGAVQFRHLFGWDYRWFVTRSERLVTVGSPLEGDFRVFATTESPVNLAVALGSAVAVAAACALAGRSTALRVAGAASLAPLLYALGLTSVRSAMLALAVTVVVLACLVPRTAPARAAAVAGSLLAGVAGWSLLGAVNGSTREGRYSLSGITADTSLLARLDLLDTFTTAAARPLGAGPGSATLAASLSDSSVTAVVDNGYLGQVVEGGLVRLVLLLAVLAAVALAVVRARRRVRADVVALACVAVVAFQVTMNLSLDVLSGGWALAFWAAAGHLLAVSVHDRRYEVHDHATPVPA